MFFLFVHIVLFDMLIFVCFINISLFNSLILFVIDVIVYHIHTIMNYIQIMYKIITRCCLYVTNKQNKYIVKDSMNQHSIINVCDEHTVFSFHPQS